MVNKPERKIVSIKVVDGAEKYPDRILYELGSLALTLQNIRKVYLATTKNDSGDDIPLLMLEPIGDSERRIEDDAFILDCAMNQLFKEASYDLQMIPSGPWWEQMKPVVQVVRDLNS